MEFGLFRFGPCGPGENPRDQKRQGLEKCGKSEIGHGRRSGGWRLSPLVHKERSVEHRVVVFDAFRQGAENVERNDREPRSFGFEMVRAHLVENHQHSRYEFLFYDVAAHADDAVTPTVEHVHDARGRVDVVRLFG